MGSITGTALQQLIEDSMASEICEKNSNLCLGKKTEKISYNLMVLYNYWVLCDMCDLTSEEINCIVNDIDKTCTFTKPVKLSNVYVENAEQVAEQTSAVLSCYVEQTSHICSARTPSGQASHTVTATGGVAPYSYVWTCQAATGYPATRIGNCSAITLLNTTTSVMSSTTMAYSKVYTFKVVVTDAIGNTCTKTIDYDDLLCQTGAYG